MNPIVIKRFTKTLLCTGLILMLNACGGGGNGGGTSTNNTSSISSLSSSSAISSMSSSSSSSSNSNSSQSSTAELTGVLIDSPVIGIKYTTQSQTGYTNAQGEFNYVEGETITFSIGDILFPEVLAQARITPYTLADSTDINNQQVINIARFLQSLDTDGDLDNGIDISPQAHTAATGISVDFSSNQFSDLVAGVLANSGSTQTTLIGTTLAQNNLTKGLGSSCSTSNAKVGQIASLMTFAHQVSGQVKVIDDCTLEFSNFNYDGGGLPDVYIYGGLNNSYSNGFKIGTNLFGKPLNNATFTVKLKNGDLDRMDGISIWCVQAGVDFGHGLFQAP